MTDHPSVIIGIISNRTWFPGKETAWWPDKTHWWLGRALAVLAVANCFLGLPLVSGTWARVPTTAIALLSTWAGITLIAAIILESAYGKRELILGTARGGWARARPVPRLGQDRAKQG